MARLVLGLNLDKFKDLRTAAMTVFQFNLMGRFSDIQNIRRGEVEELEGGHLRFKVVTAKNYESYDPRSSLIVSNPSGLIFCVGIIKRYMQARGGSSQDFLFCNFRMKNNKPEMLNTVVSYDNCMKSFRCALIKVDLPGESFSLHSLKTGALSEARNSGLVNSSVLERHARWVTKKMVDRYYSQSLEVSLLPTKALAINQS